MIEIKETYDRNVAELDEYCCFLDDLLIREAKILLSDDSCRRLGITLSSTLKSSFFLMQYNLVESTISNVLDFVHNSVIDEKVSYNNLSENFQNIWLEYFLLGKTPGTNSIKATKNLIENINKEELFTISFSEYSSVKTVFSGNLDSRKIREISSKYGFDIKKSNLGSKLLVVKHKRNKLAHGEIAFSQGGKDIVNSDILKIKKDSIEFLYLFIEAAQKFVVNKLYLKKQARAKIIHLPGNSVASNVSGG